MASFTVEAVERGKEIDGQYGKLVVYKVRLGQNGHSLDAEWLRKLDTPAPQQGQTVNGEVTDGQYGKKFKQAPPGRGGGFNGRRDPAETKAIQRQHSQEMAIRLVDVAAGLGLVKPKDTAGLFEVVKKTTDWFEKDIPA